MVKNVHTHHRNMSVVEIIGPEDCHDIHVLLRVCKLLTSTVNLLSIQIYHLECRIEDP